MQDSTKLPPMQPNQEIPTTPPTQINTNSKPNKKQNTNPRPPKFLRYLFKLTPALGQQNNLIVECLPGSRFEAELKNVGDGLFGAGHLAGQPHLLLHIQQLLYRRLQIPSAFLRIFKESQKKTKASESTAIGIARLKFRSWGKRLPLNSFWNSIETLAQRKRVRERERESVSELKKAKARWFKELERRFGF